MWLQPGGARRGGCTLCLQQLWVGGTCTVVVLSGSVCLVVFVCECLGHCTLRRLWVYGLAYDGLRCLLLPPDPVPSSGPAVKYWQLIGFSGFSGFSAADDHWGGLV